MSKALAENSAAAALSSSLSSATAPLKMPEHSNLGDLNPYRGLGESPTYSETVVEPRYWPCDKWLAAPPPEDGTGFGNFSWKGVRLLKDPETQVVYHDLLWSLKPATVIELGVYSGGSLLWMRDLLRAFGRPDAELYGVDRDLDRVRIPAGPEMAGIHLSAGDLTHPEQALEFLVKKAAAGELRRPVLLIDDCHANTFNVLRFAVNRLLGEGDYVVVEDTMALWRRYSPQALGQRMAAFTDVMVLDRQFARLPGQTANSIFRVTK